MLFHVTVNNLLGISRPCFLRQFNYYILTFSFPLIHSSPSFVMFLLGKPDYEVSKVHAFYKYCCIFNGKCTSRNPCLCICCAFVLNPSFGLLSSWQFFETYMILSLGKLLCSNPNCQCDRKLSIFVSLSSRACTSVVQHLQAYIYLFLCLVFF